MAPSHWKTRSLLPTFGLLGLASALDEFAVSKIALSCAAFALSLRGFVGWRRKGVGDPDDGPAQLL